MSVTVERPEITKAFTGTDVTPYSTLLLSVLRLLLVTSIHDLPIKWNYTHGSRNEQAEMEGPFYVIGAPSRQISEGKGVMAVPGLLKAHVPFLMTIRILSPEGKPVPNVTLDWWQADSTGTYYFAQYKLRGTVTTDANGVVEVLTVAPAAYGLGSIIRPGHIHLIIRPAKEDAKKYDDLTTQLYVCKGNDAKAIGFDIINYMRKAREGLVLKAWSIPSSSAGQRYMDFPELSSEAPETAKVGVWNKLLSELGNVRIVAGASTDIKLNAKTGWF